MLVCGLLDKWQGSRFDTSHLHLAVPILSWLLMFQKTLILYIDVAETLD